MPQFDVFNTSSWTRTGLALLPHELSEAGDRVSDERGRPVPSQRLAGRELAVLIRDLPPFAGRRYTITKALPFAEGRASAKDAVLDNGGLRVSVDPQTGGIVELRARGIDVNLADTASGHAINDYLYLIGDDPATLQKNGPVKISVRDHGPLMASLLVESDAPGCHRLSRELRVTAGGDYVELLDTVDKKRLAVKSYMAWDGKESVHFAFPFHVPGGQIRLDVPFGLVRPELDQMPSACKNWLTVGRWADVANADFGVTWVTLDAPLVQIGGITATLLNSQTNPAIWRKKIEPTQQLYSWAMNNHWGTNYRAYQEGPVQFRFVVRPHRAVTAADTTRFATSFSQPLVAVPARGANPPGDSLFRVEPAAAVVTALKPADEGRALIVRLFNADDKPARVKLIWDRNAAKQVWLSDTSERPVQAAPETIELPASGLVTLPGGNAVSGFAGRRPQGILAPPVFRGRLSFRCRRYNRASECLTQEQSMSLPTGHPVNRKVIGRVIEDLVTPALLLDGAIADRDIRRMADFFRNRLCRLRPQFEKPSLSRIGAAPGEGGRHFRDRLRHLE